MENLIETIEKFLAYSDEKLRRNWLKKIKNYEKKITNQLKKNERRSQ